MTRPRADPSVPAAELGGHASSSRHGSGDAGGIRCVFFDLGGTLLDFRDPLEWSEVAAAVGYPVEPEHLAHAVAEMERATDVEERVGPDDFWRGALEIASGRPVPLADGARFLTVWRGRQRRGRLFSDVGRCLDEFRSQGVRMGIISNSESAESVARYLVDAGIRAYFDPVISSGTEGVAKPDARIFQAATARAGVRPAEAVHVGDLPTTDARGALRAGLHGVWLRRDGTGFGDELPEITSLSELPGVVRELAARAVK